MLNFKYKSTVNYGYSLPNDNKEQFQLIYHWNYNDEWTVCSKSCGKGQTILEAKCYELTIGKVDDSFCDANEKPDTIYEICNVFECEPDWLVGEWQKCEGSCFDGSYGIQKRSVSCVRQRPNSLNDKLEIIGLPEIKCNVISRPVSISECLLNQTECDSDSYIGWIAEEWTNVNKP
jgi:hypothetical protein